MLKPLINQFNAINFSSLSIKRYNQFIMKYFFSFLCVLGLSHFTVSAQEGLNFKRATATLEAVYANYAVPNSKLLREHYPFDNKFKADYLGGGENSQKANPYSYLWPYSGSLSAQVARYEAKKSRKIKKEIDETVLVGLASYFDKRAPYGYASYVNTAAPSDRFYDDNVWLGIDYTDLFLLTKDSSYLRNAKEIWAFVASGMDDKLGGGIYWCEQRKESKNTCSNAPSVVYLLKLYEATQEAQYLSEARELYLWTKKNLQDPSDFLYWDNISLSGKVDRTKYAYNSGQMLQAAALLYKITKETAYLTEAQQIAKASHAYFFTDFTPETGAPFKLLKTSNNWFLAVMMRGFVELYHQDQDKQYLQSFQQNLDYAWLHMRDNKGLFSQDWSGKKQLSRKALLDQFALIEMYARLAK